MTVKELLEALSPMPDDAVVYYESDADDAEIDDAEFDDVGHLVKLHPKV